MAVQYIQFLPNTTKRQRSTWIKREKSENDKARLSEFALVSPRFTQSRVLSLSLSLSLSRVRLQETTECFVSTSGSLNEAL